MGSMFFFFALVQEIDFAISYWFVEIFIDI
jgi:hypothetical protein